MEMYISYEAKLPCYDKKTHKKNGWKCESLVLMSIVAVHITEFSSPLSPIASSLK